MSASHIRYEVEADGVAILTIDRPGKRNAMTWAMLDAFTAGVLRAGDDAAARVLIVTGAGGSFCAGTDLADLANRPPEARGARAEGASRETPWPLLACPKPVIGAIDGWAVGMGAEFTSQCDVRIITDRARIAWNFAHRGLVPDTGAGSWILPRLIGPSRALALLYSGEPLEAAAALAIGYAAAVTAPEALMDAARAEARRYLKSSPFSLARMKALVWAGLARGVAEHMGAHAEALAACFRSEDHEEGVAAFLERRPARFVGR